MLLRNERNSVIGSLLNLIAKAIIGKEAVIILMSQDRGVFGYFCLLFVSVHIGFQYDLIFVLLHGGHSVAFLGVDVL